MATTIIDGPYYSDLIVGEVEDVSQDLKFIAPGATPFSNSIGLASAQGCDSLTHKWPDMAYRPVQNTLNGSFASTATSVTFSLANYKVGDVVMTGGEKILLTVNSGDSKTFTCVRSKGTPAAATHATGTECVLIGNATIENWVAGESDKTFEPALITNYVQKATRVIEVSDAANRANRHGRPGTAYDDKAKQLIRDISIEVDQFLLAGHGATASATSSSTAPTCKGLTEFIFDAGNSTDMSSVNGGYMTQQKFRDMVDAISDYYDPSTGKNPVALVPMNQSFVFDDWQQAHVTVPAGDPLVATYGIDVNRLRVGGVLIDLITVPRLKAHKQLICYMPDLVVPRVAVKLTHEALPREGTIKRGMLYIEATVEVHGEGKHGWDFYGLT